MGLGMNFFFGPFTSALCDRFGCRVVAMVGGLISVTAMFATSFINSLVSIYLTYSILWGMGSSMCFVPTFLMVGRYFERRRSLANGIITAGSAVGALVMGPTINMLLERVGWRNTMRILAGVACATVLAALTYRAPPVKTDVNFEQKRKKIIDISVWKNKGFIVWAFALAIFNLGYFVPYVYLVSWDPFPCSICFDLSIKTNCSTAKIKIANLLTELRTFLLFLVLGICMYIMPCSQIIINSIASRCIAVFCYHRFWKTSLTELPVRYLWICLVMYNNYSMGVRWIWEGRSYTPRWL